jgi:hypothetical protein
MARLAAQARPDRRKFPQLNVGRGSCTARQALGKLPPETEALIVFGNSRLPVICITATMLRAGLGCHTLLYADFIISSDLLLLLGQQGGQHMATKLTLVSLALIALLGFVSCTKQESSPTTVAASSKAAGTKSCCQCPGVWNDPPTTPPSYKLQPDCADSSPGEKECEADCKSKGYVGGALLSGTCQAVKSPGVGNICQ